MITNVGVSEYILGLKDKIAMTADVEYFMEHNNEVIQICHDGCTSYWKGKDYYTLRVDGEIIDNYLTLEEAHILANDELNKKVELYENE